MTVEQELPTLPSRRRSGLATNSSLHPRDLIITSSSRAWLFAACYISTEQLTMITCTAMWNACICGPVLRTGKENCSSHASPVHVKFRPLDPGQKPLQIKRHPGSFGALPRVSLSH